MPLVLKEFRPAKHQYALKPDTFTATADPRIPNFWTYKTDAFWFEALRNGKIAIHYGICSEYSSHRFGGPTEAYDFEEMLENSYQGRRAFWERGTWTGSSVYWVRGFRDEERKPEILDFMKEALKNYGEIPEGFVGWYQPINTSVYRTLKD